MNLPGCLVVANKSITQVLVFKCRSESASFRANNAKVSINRAALSELGLLIPQKTRAYQADDVSTALEL